MLQKYMMMKARQQDLGPVYGSILLHMVLLLMATWHYMVFPPQALPISPAASKVVWISDIALAPKGVAVKPVASQPVVAKLAVTRPAVAKPVVVRPPKAVVSKPSTVKPVSGKLASAAHVRAKPVQRQMLKPLTLPPASKVSHSSAPRVIKSTPPAAAVPPKVHKAAPSSPRPEQILGKLPAQMDDLIAAEQKELAEQEQAELAEQKQVETDRILARYQQKILVAIGRHWLIPQGVSRNLSAVFDLKLAASGQVLHVERVRSSGNEALDQSASLAIRKASPLPVPQDVEVFEHFQHVRLTVRPQQWVHE